MGERITVNEGDEIDNLTFETTEESAKLGFTIMKFSTLWMCGLASLYANDPNSVGIVLYIVFSSNYEYIVFIFNEDDPQINLGDRREYFNETFIDSPGLTELCDNIKEFFKDEKGELGKDYYITMGIETIIDNPKYIGEYDCMIYNRNLPYVIKRLNDYWLERGLKFVVFDSQDRLDESEINIIGKEYVINNE